MPHPSRIGRSPAVTLMEVLVAGFLLTLLVGITTRFFQISSRISGRELDKNSAEALLLGITTQLENDLSSASPAGLSLSLDGSVAVIHPVSLSDVGTVVYQNRLLCWRYAAADELLRRGRAESYSGFLFDGSAFRAEASEFGAIATSSEFADRGRFEGVSDFRLLSNPDVPAPHIGTPLTLHLAVQLNRADRALTVSKTLHLRNSGS